MKVPSNPDLLAEYQRYKTALAEYLAAKKVFRQARKELKSSRIGMLRAKKAESRKNLRKKAEIDEPRT